MLRESEAIRRVGINSSTTAWSRASVTTMKLPIGTIRLCSQRNGEPV